MAVTLNIDEESYEFSFTFNVELNNGKSKSYLLKIRNTEDMSDYITLWELKDKKDTNGLIVFRASHETSINYELLTEDLRPLLQMSYTFYEKLIHKLLLYRNEMSV